MNNFQQQYSSPNTFYLFYWYPRLHPRKQGWVQIFWTRCILLLRILVSTASQSLIILSNHTFSFQGPLHWLFLCSFFWHPIYLLDILCYIQYIQGNNGQKPDECWSNGAFCWAIESPFPHRHQSYSLMALLLFFFSGILCLSLVSWFYPIYPREHGQKPDECWPNGAFCILLIEFLKWTISLQFPGSICTLGSAYLMCLLSFFLLPGHIQ